MQNGLRAYQEAKGLKADGRMEPGGATERALHRQIGVQQRRLKDQLAKDAAEAAAKLSAGGWSGNAGALGSPQSVAAQTLGARTTGAKVEAQQRQAYAEALDRMKRAASDTPANGDTEAGSDAAKHRPGGGPALPPAATGGNRTESAALPSASIPPATTLDAVSGAENRDRAEARKHVGLGDIEHEAERRERQRRQRAADRAFRTGRGRGSGVVHTIQRGLDIAIEHGALPRSYRPWLERAFSPQASSGSPEAYLAALDRLTALRNQRRAVFDTLSSRLRTAVAVHRHIEAKYGGTGAEAGRAGGPEARRRRAALVQGTVDDLHRPDVLKNLGFAADWLPVIGEIKSGAEALIALRNYAAARERGDSKAAARYGDEAAWGIFGAIPGLSYTRKGRALLKRLAAPVGKLNAKAGREFARKVEETVFGRIVAQRRLAIFEGNWEDPSIRKFNPKEVFGDSLGKMDKDDRKDAIRLLRFAKGSAAEETVNRNMQRAGFKTKIRGSGKAVNPGGLGTRIYDIATPHAVKSVAGLFLAPAKYKGTVRNGKITVVEVKSDLAQGPSKQRAKDEAVKTAIKLGDFPEVLRTGGQQVVADLRLFRVPIHQIDKKDLVESVQNMLARRFDKQTIDDLVKDIEAFHRRSRDGDAKPFGIVVLYLASRLRTAKPEA